MPVENKTSNFEVNEGRAEVQAPPKKAFPHHFEVASTICGFNNLLLLWPDTSKTIGLYRHFGGSNDSFGYDIPVSCSNRV